MVLEEPLTCLRVCLPRHPRALECPSRAPLLTGCSWSPARFLSVMLTLLHFHQGACHSPDLLVPAASPCTCKKQVPARSRPYKKLGPRMVLAKSRLLTLGGWSAVPLPLCISGHRQCPWESSRSSSFSMPISAQGLEQLPWGKNSISCYFCVGHSFDADCS